MPPVAAAIKPALQASSALADDTRSAAMGGFCRVVTRKGADNIKEASGTMGV